MTCSPSSPKLSRPKLSKPDAFERDHTPPDISDVPHREVPAKALALPSTVSDELKSAISRYPIPSVDEVINNTPQSVEQWREMIQIRNGAQKKKIKQMRKQFDVDVSLEKINGVTVRRLTPNTIAPEFKNKVFIDVHGGGYVFFAGLPSIEESLLIAHRVGITVISIDYRMPPHAPFPAALNDVVSVYSSLAAEHGAHNLFIGGTSAGAGLVLSAVQTLIKTQQPLPLAVYAGTPWADLTKTGDTLFTNESIDRILVTYEGFLAASASLYAGQECLTHPSISPLNGNFAGFPPTFLLSGTRDMFLSDTVRVNRKLRDAQVRTQLEVFEGLSHADYVVAYDTPESHSVYQELKQFLFSMCTIRCD
ncbi:alpha/beta hydrolase [Alteromonas sp. 1_MG-2023]|uniref:alpha/beta hydrolase n=1 Tax=Alteromonas sp. 1_MG-2023 TaxID=3062669 RepID=UPI0026E1D6A5|nr:alpha/beta hydrolase [Alteromonas sp. 1_MG-2023]MDO6568024.1 alpha/beta hydrolase [Alteromonas sp. 1_MG-2023]